MYLLRRILKVLLSLLITAAIIGAIVFGGIKFYQYLQERADNPEEPPTTEEPQPEEPGDGIKVETITIKAPKTQPNSDKNDPTDDQFQKTGLIVADQEVQIVPELGAKITEISVQEGQQVEAGEKLAKLGDSTQVAQLVSNYNSAAELLKIAESSLKLTETSGQLSQYSVQQQMRSAAVNIDNAVEQLRLAQDIRQNQFFVEDLTRYEQYQAEQEAAEAAASQNSDNQDSTTDTMLQSSLENVEIIDQPRRRTDADPRYPQGSGLAQRYLQQQQGHQQDLQSINQIETTQLQLEQLATQLKSTQVQSEIQRLSSTNQIVQLRTQIEQAKISLNSLNLTSPIAGVVSSIDVRPGQTVNPGQAIITITNFNSIVVETSLTPTELAQLKQSTKVSVKIGNQTVPAQIIKVAVVADQVSKTIPVQLVPSTDAQIPLVPQTFASVIFDNSKTDSGDHGDSDNDDNKTDNTKNLISLPLGIIKFDNGKASVAIVEADKVAYLNVKIAKIDNGRAYIETKIPTGTKVITSPRHPKLGTPIAND